MDYLNSQISANPDQADVFNDLKKLYRDRLYHQLSLKILQTTVNPWFNEQERLVLLHNKFVVDFCSHINQLVYARFAVFVAKQLSGPAGIEFLEKVLKTVSADIQAVVLCQLELSRRALRVNKLEDSKSLLDESKNQIDGYMGIMDGLIYSQFYKASLEYFKLKQDPAEYFRCAILYLTYTPLESIAINEQVQLASDVGLSALLGKNTYNFGELLQHPILKVLKDHNEWGWLPQMLHAFNRGDIGKYKEIFDTAGKKQAPLAQNAASLSEKVKIMGFMDMVFNRPSHDRHLEFKEIAKRCDVKVSDVEFVVLKAFALKVMKGVIDEVGQSVRISWVQPRVLDGGQISHVGDLLKSWSQTVRETTLFVEDNAVEIVTHAKI